MALVCFSLPVSAFATTIPGNQTVAGVEPYITSNENGTISLDSTAAINAGVDYAVVDAVSKNISDMNSLVLNSAAYIDENLTLVVELASPRSGGVSKVTTTWYGLTQIYMNAADTQVFITNLSSVGDVATVGGMVGLLPGSVASVVGGISTIFGFETLLYRSQAESAAKGGNGIIMNIQTDILTQTQSIYFTAQ